MDRIRDVDRNRVCGKGKSPQASVVVHAAVWDTGQEQHDSALVTALTLLLERSRRVDQ